MHPQGATIAQHVPTYVATPGAFWSVDLDIQMRVKTFLLNERVM